MTAFFKNKRWQSFSEFPESWFAVAIVFCMLLATEAVDGLIALYLFVRWRDIPAVLKRYPQVYISATALALYMVLRLFLAGESVGFQSELGLRIIAYTLGAGIAVSRYKNDAPLHRQLLVWMLASLAVFGFVLTSFLSEGRGQLPDFGLTHSGFLIAGMLITFLYWVGQQIRQQRFPRRYWLFAIAVSGLLAIGVLLNLSRGVWLAGFAVLAIFALRLPLKFQLAGLLMLGLLAGSLTFAPERVTSALSSRVTDMQNELVFFQLWGTNHGSFGERLGMWETAVTAGLQSPLIGQGYEGLDGVQQALVAAGDVSKKVASRGRLHSDPLMFFATFGVVGLALWSWFLVSVFLTCQLVPRAVGTFIIVAGLSDHYFFLSQSITMVSSLFWLSALWNGPVVAKSRAKNRVHLLPVTILILLISFTFFVSYSDRLAEIADIEERPRVLITRDNLTLMRTKLGFRVEYTPCVEDEVRGTPFFLHLSAAQLPDAGAYHLDELKFDFNVRDFSFTDFKIKQDTCSLDLMYGKEVVDNIFFGEKQSGDGRAWENRMGLGERYLLQP